MKTFLLFLSLACAAIAQVSIPWTDVDKTGSSLADLATRSAGALNSGTLDAARLPTTITQATTFSNTIVVNPSGATVAEFKRSGTTPTNVGWTFGADNTGPYIDTQVTHRWRGFVNGSEVFYSTAAGFSVVPTTASTSTTTGAFTIGGGLGAGGAGWFGNQVNSQSTGFNASFVARNTTPSTGRVYTFGSDDSGNAYIRDGTAAANRLTIASTGEIAALSTTEATAVGAGSLTTAGGIYSAKKIVNNSDAYFALNGGKVLIGTGVQQLTSSGLIPTLQVHGDGLQLFQRTGADSVASAIYFQKTRAANGVFTTATQSGDNLAFIAAEGADGVSAMRRAAGIIMRAEGLFTASSSPGSITLQTTPSGSTGAIDRATLTSDGAFNVMTGRVAIGASGSSDTDTFLTLYPQTSGNSIYHVSNSTGILRFSRGSLGAETSHDMTLSGSGLAVAATTASSSTTTGALTVAGGVGVSGAGYFGGAVNAGNLGIESTLLTLGRINYTGADSSNAQIFAVQKGGATKFRVQTDEAVAVLTTTEATTAGVGSLTTAGGIYAAKKIIAGTSISPSGSAVTWTAGVGSPEGVVTAVVGSLYSRTDGGAGSSLYVKESGAGNTGWVAK